MKKIISIVVGVFLIFIGIVCWLLPIVPGWPLILIGASFIAPDFARRLKRRLFRRVINKDVVYLDNLKKFRVRAGFTTRHLPVVLHKGEDLSDLSKQNEFVGAISATKALADRHESRFVFLDQVHGDRIAILEDEAAFKDPVFTCLGETDGVLTNLERLTLLVLTADCLPVFLIAGRDNGRWIGLVHAGWRGTQKRIVEKAFEMIRTKSGCRASDIRVVFGPCIGKDHYEVGEEFVGYFGKVGAHGRAPLHRKNGKLYFDLVGETKRQLLEAGALKNRITDLDLCTACDPENLYSFRLEKEKAGRLVSFISIL